MGRAGAGSGGGRSRSSSGGHSSSRSSGGHRVSSSSRRAGSSSSYRGSSSYRSSSSCRGGYSPGPYVPYGARRVSGGGCLGSIVGWIVALVVISFVLQALALIPQSSGIPKSSYNREPLQETSGFDNNCIIDELDWFDNIGSASRKLQYFYDETGVQPFIYLRAYDSSLTTDSQKQAFAEDWYEENIDDETTFFFLYFAEPNQDEDVGYMAYVNGKRVSSVMDAEAIEVFWAYVDDNWYSTKSTDDMFADIYASTADRIMTKTTTSNDIVKTVVVLVIVVVVIAGIIGVMKTRRKHESERNAETERILRADLKDSSASGDSTLDKWS